MVGLWSWRKHNGLEKREINTSKDGGDEVIW